MDWSRGGRVDRFRFVRVAWPSFEELGEIDGVSSFEYERSYLTDLQVTGKAVRAGAWGMGDDMVRAYSVSELDGESVELCHCTLMASEEPTEFGAASCSSTASLYSTLLVLQEEQIDESLTVPQGSDPVAEACRIVESRGLRVTGQRSGGPALPGASRHEAGSTVLSVVNSLLSSGGFQAAGSDAWGGVAFSPYVDPSGRSPVARVDEETGGTLLCSPSFERSVGGVAYNVVTLVGTDADGMPVRAQARNDSVSSRWSTASRRRTVSLYEEVDGVTTAEHLAESARRRMRESTMGVETLSVRHFWGGFGPRDAVEVSLPSRGVEGVYSATSIRCRLSKGMVCDTSMRRTVDLEGAL